jgi:hypothetical protein
MSASENKGAKPTEFLYSVQRVQIKGPLALGLRTGQRIKAAGAAALAAAQFWTAAASSRLGVLINRAFRELREGLVGLFFLSEGCLKQLSSVI